MEWLPREKSTGGHLRECPLAMVECELKELGCEEVVQRKDADKHMEQAAQKHTKLMASHYLKSQRRQDEKIIRLQEENERLIRGLNEAQEQHGKLASQIDLIKRHSAMYVTELNVNYRERKRKNGRWENDILISNFFQLDVKSNLTCTCMILLENLKLSLHILDLKLMTSYRGLGNSQ